MNKHGHNKNRSRNNNNNSHNHNHNHRQKRSPNLVNRSFDSNGPDVRIRGNANQICEKYQTLARDAYVAGDRIAAENYMQHAEHYYRIMLAAQAQQQQYTQQQQPQRANGGQRFDPTSEQSEEYDGADTDHSGFNTPYQNTASALIQNGEVADQNESNESQDGSDSNDVGDNNDVSDSNDDGENSDHSEGVEVVEPEVQVKVIRPKKSAAAAAVAEPTDDGIAAA